MQVSVASARTTPKLDLPVESERPSPHILFSSSHHSELFSIDVAFLPPIANSRS